MILVSFTWMLIGYVLWLRAIYVNVRAGWPISTGTAFSTLIVALLLGPLIFVLRRIAVARLERDQNDI